MTTIKQIPKSIHVLHPNNDLVLSNSINIRLVFFKPSIPASKYCSSPSLDFSMSNNSTYILVLIVSLSLLILFSMSLFIRKDRLIFDSDVHI